VQATGCRLQEREGVCSGRAACRCLGSLCNRLNSAQIEEQGFSGFGGGEGEHAGLFGAGGVAGGERFAVEGKFTLSDVEPGTAARGELVGDGLARCEADAVNVGVLMNGRGLVAAVGRNYENFRCVGMFGFRVPLVVAGLETGFAGLDPDLEEVGEFAGGGIELAVGHATTGAHELDLAGLEGAAVTQTVLVGECAFEHVAEDFHVAVRVGTETFASGNAVVVDDAERAEAHVGGIVVVSEGEGVVGI